MASALSPFAKSRPQNKSWAPSHPDSSTGSCGMIPRPRRSFRNPSPAVFTPSIVMLPEDVKRVYHCKHRSVISHQSQSQSQSQSRSQHTHSTVTAQSQRVTRVYHRIANTHQNPISMGAYIVEITLGGCRPMWGARIELSTAWRTVKIKPKSRVPLSSRFCRKRATNLKVQFRKF